MIIGNKNGKRIIALLIVVLFLAAYKYSPYKIPFIGHYDKVWAHRVNSTEKLQSALIFYEGIELDLDFNAEANFLDVNHPPTASIGLDFDTYLSKIDQDKKPFMWLDIKHMTGDNYREIYSLITNLVEKYKYPKSKILIETRHPETLPIFSAYGFKTSYYLNPKISKLGPKAFKKEIASIKTIVLQQPEIAISSSYVDYDIMTSYFPDHDKYIWATSRKLYKDFFKVRKLLNDSTVKVVLAKYKALSGNR